jgi:hypothetical protein
MAVTKQWSQSTFQRGESAEDVYWVDAADENVASFASGVPQQNTSHLLDPRLLVQGSPAVRALMPGTLYEVRVRYVRLRGGGNETEDPFNKAPVVHWQIGNTNEPVDSDVDGNPILNSVGDVVEGLTEEFPTLHVAHTRPVGSYDIQKALAYGNKTNSDSFSIKGPNGPMSVNQGQALCRSITAEPYALDAEYVMETTLLEFREDGFKRRLLDQGYHGLYDDSGTTRIDRFSNGKGELWALPVRLNGGKPIKQGSVDFKVGAANKTPIAGTTPKGAEPDPKSTAEAKFFLWKRKKSIAFSGLNL